MVTIQKVWHYFTTVFLAVVLWVMNWLENLIKENGIFLLILLLLVIYVIVVKVLKDKNKFL